MCLWKESEETLPKNPDISGPAPALLYGLVLNGSPGAAALMAPARGQNWAQQSPASSPSSRELSAMAYDAARSWMMELCDVHTILRLPTGIF